MRAFTAVMWLLPVFMWLAPAECHGVVVDSTYVWGHWTVGDSPFLVARSILLREEDQLIIDPGVEVRFMDPAYNFTVNGTLLAAGTSVDSILFSSSAPQDFDWNGMIFNEKAGGSRLKHCIIEHSTTQVVDGGGVRVHVSSPSFTGCAIRHCVAGDDGGGIYLFDSASLIEDCRFSANEADGDGGAIMIEGLLSSVRVKGCTITENNAHSGGGIAIYQATAAVQGCSIVGNECYSIGGGIYSVGAALTVSDSKCNENYAYLNGGAGINVQAGSATIRGTDISENWTTGGSAPGLAGQFVDPLVLEYVSICWNRDGVAGIVGGIFVDATVLSLDHVTVFHNISAGVGGLRAWGESLVTLDNSVFATNYAGPEILIEWFSVADISHCDVAGGPDQAQTAYGGVVNWLEGNIFEDPLFCDPYPSLQDCSPCVGAGSGGSTIGSAGVGCPCDDPTSVEDGAVETSWSRIKGLYR